MAEGRQYIYAASAPADVFYAGPLGGARRRPRSLLSGKYLSRRGSAGAQDTGDQDIATDPCLRPRADEHADVNGAPSGRGSQASGAAAATLTRSAYECGEKAVSPAAAKNIGPATRQSFTPADSPTLLSMLKHAPPGSYTDTGGHDGILSRCVDGGLKRDGRSQNGGDNVGPLYPVSRSPHTTVAGPSNLPRGCGGEGATPQRT